MLTQVNVKSLSNFFKANWWVCKWVSTSLSISKHLIVLALDANHAQVLTPVLVPNSVIWLHSFAYFVNTGRCSLISDLVIHAKLYPNSRRSSTVTFTVYAVKLIF